MNMQFGPIRLAPRAGPRRTTSRTLAAAAVVVATATLAPVPAQAAPIPSIYVCKNAAGPGVTGTYTFHVTPPNVSVAVPVGGCTRVTVNAVNPQGIKVTETAVNNVAVTNIAVASGTVLASSLPNRTVTVADDAYVFVPFQQTAVSGAPGTVTFSNKKFPAPPCTPPPNGMTAWYPFDETYGLNATNLRPPSPSAALVNGPVHAPAKVGYGLQFDGVDDYARSTTGDPNVGAAPFSVDFWIQTTSQGGPITILDKRTGQPYNNNNNLVGWSVVVHNGKILLQLANGSSSGGGFTNYLSNVVVNDGEWHFVAITIERGSSTGITFYDNGFPVLPNANPIGRQGNLSNAAPLTIGNDTIAFTGTYFKGILDEVEIFTDVVLTPTQVRLLWQAGSSGKCKPIHMPKSA